LLSKYISVFLSCLELVVWWWILVSYLILFYNCTIYINVIFNYCKFMFVFFTYLNTFYVIKILLKCLFKCTFLTQVSMAVIMRKIWSANLIFMAAIAKLSWWNWRGDTNGAGWSKGKELMFLCWCLLYYDFLYWNWSEYSCYFFLLVNLFNVALLIFHRVWLEIEDMVSLVLSKDTFKTHCVIERFIRYDQCRFLKLCLFLQKGVNLSVTLSLFHESIRAI